MGTLIGVDVGGTFTDVVALDSSAGEVRVAKVPTTVLNQADGFVNGLRELGRTSLDDVDLILHGTTTGTNAILERKGASCGLITTKGFRDVLELGRRTRPSNYGLFGSYEPLIPRELRVEVTERMDSTGSPVVELAEAEVRQAASFLRKRGASAVLIAFLHSYANASHENRARELVHEVWSDAYVTTSSEVLQEFREFERISSGAVNACLRPIIDRYVSTLIERLSEMGYCRDLLIMQGNGGVMHHSVACRLPVHTVLSGPAAGVIAAAHISRRIGFDRVVTGDMGGTSFDVALVVGGAPGYSSEHSLGYNVPVQIPMIDITTIGAGGGSIAHLAPSGLLRVGPESAGATPGPVAYGRGGLEPTLTDANVLLGRINPSGMLSVAGEVDLTRVRDAIEERIAKPLGLDPFAAAAAIIRVANDRMASALRSVSLARGYDPRDFAYFGFGGGGGLNAVELSRELSIPTAIVPFRPGLTSALGVLVAHLRHDFVKTIYRSFDLMELHEVWQAIGDFSAEGNALLSRETAPITEVVVAAELEMQYEGQTHGIRVPIAPVDTTEEILARFQALSEQAYGSAAPSGIGIRVMNVRCAVVGLREDVPLEALVPVGRAAKSLSEAEVGSRQVWFESGWTDTPIFDRERLPRGVEFDGPAILEQLDGTTVLHPNSTARTDDLGNLIITVGA